MAAPRGTHVLHRLILGKCENIFLSETTSPRAFIFGAEHNLVDLYQVCPGGQMFNIGLYRENVNISSSLKQQGLGP